MDLMVVSVPRATDVDAVYKSARLLLWANVFTSSLIQYAHFF